MASGHVSRRRGVATRATAAAVFAALAVSAADGPAGAQVTVAGHHDVLDRIVPPMPGVTVQVLTTVGQEMVIANPTSTTLVVPAESGEAFLRIGPAGVQANISSPTWYRSNDPTGVAPMPAGADASAPPRWALVSTEASWGWFDPRLAGAAPSPTGIGGWVVPVRYGQQTVAISGHYEMRRSTGALIAKLVPLTAPAAGLLVGAVQGSVPGIFLSVSGPQTVVVLGQSGEPLLRVRHDGVEVNRASPTWSLTAAARGEAPDGVVDANAPPRWRQLDRVGRISWLEPRAAYPPGEPPAGVQARRSATDLLTWSVPLLVDSARSDLRGVTSWVPNLSPESPGLQAASAALHARRVANHRHWTPLVIAAVSVALGCGAAGLMGRRRFRTG